MCRGGLLVADYLPEPTMYPVLSSASRASTSAAFPKRLETVKSAAVLPFSNMHTKIALFKPLQRVLVGDVVSQKNGRTLWQLRAYLLQRLPFVGLPNS